MSHTYTSLFFHIIFATRERRPLISNEQSGDLYAYLGGIARNLHFELILAGGTSNHIHLLVSIPPALPITTAIQKLKANSSRFLGPTFSWQEGYGAFTVSASQLPALKLYVANQEEHHRRRSFEGEFLALLEKAGVTHDPRSVFYNRMPSPEGDSAPPQRCPSTHVLG